MAERGRAAVSPSKDWKSLAGSQNPSDHEWRTDRSFDFTIIVPANLASHDWHTNGVIAHVLYAEVEGLPDPNDWGIHKSASTSSLFGLRKASRSASRPGSRGASPTASPPLSPSLTPRTGRSLSRTSFAIPSGSTTPPLSSVAVETHCGANLDAALSNLAIAAPRAVPARRGSPAPTSTPTSPRSGSPVASPRSSSQAPMGGGTRPNPAHIAGAHSLSITRQEDVVLPRVPSYDDSMATLRENDGQTPDWIMGTHTTRRNCMIVYNPNVSGGTNELSERANGFVPGLGAWSWQMGTDVVSCLLSLLCLANVQWCIGALLSLNVKFTNLTPLTTVFSVSLLLNQTHSVVSPRDVGGDDKHASTRTFTILSRGKRPAEGHYYPDKSHAALWRGKGAGGEDDDALGELEVDAKARMPNDNVARPSTVPGVVTPITVSHTFTLEIAFSVWGEDDLGNKMDKPGYGGLRVMRVSRPVLVPSVSCPGVELVAERVAICACMLCTSFLLLNREQVLTTVLSRPRRPGPPTM